MKKWAILAGLLSCLAACDKPVDVKATVTNDSEARSNGRWSIVPIPELSKNTAQEMVAVAWRVDTFTGRLQLCQFVDRGQKVATLICGEPDDAPKN